MNKVAVFTAVVLIATGILGTATMSGTAFAQLDKDEGASGFAPKEDPKIPGWDPDRAEEDAPGIEAEIPDLGCPNCEPPSEIPPVPCDNCADDLSPGKEGLESDIIGPNK